MPATDQGQHEADLDLLRDAAREAGQIALRYFRRDPKVWTKGGGSPVSEADIAVNSYLQKRLMSARPDYGWLSEETTDSDARLKNARVFVVDPIDGTRGFLDGQTSWCVSIAVVQDGGSETGVLDCPARDEVYWAQRDAGAYRNGARLRVGQAHQPPRLAGAKPTVDRFSEISGMTVERVAYIPSLAYRIAMIAAGSLDATFVKANAHDWDLAAAVLILSEAGGVIRRLDETGLTFAGQVTTHGALVAGVPGLVKTMAGAWTEQMKTETKKHE